MNKSINNLVKKASIYFLFALTLLVVVVATSTKGQAQTYVTSSAKAQIYTIDSNVTSLTIKVSSNSEVVFVKTNSQRIVVETKAHIYTSESVYMKMAEFGKYHCDALHTDFSSLNIAQTRKAGNYIKGKDGKIIQERIYIKVYVPNFVKQISLES